MRFSIRKDHPVWHLPGHAFILRIVFFLLQRLLLEQEFSALEIRSVALDVARSGNAIKGRDAQTR
jgi:hypothetical protein